MAKKVLLLLAALLLVLAFSVQPAMAGAKGSPGHPAKMAPAPGGKTGPAKPVAHPPGKGGPAKPAPPAKPDPGKPGPGKPGNVCTTTSQNGSARHPWLICTPEDLALLHNHPDAYFELRADLDMTGINWTPVASFSGHLDGKNHTIANLQASIGLINVIEQGGKVQNLKLTNAAITSYYIGGILAGTNRGTVEKVETSGIVDGRWDLGLLAGVNEGTIRHSSAKGTIRGDTNLGGIVARNAAGGQILHSHATAVISGNYYTGGIAATNYGVIAHARADGTIRASAGVHGGIVGLNEGTVDKSHSHNDIHHYSGFSYSVGLVFGMNNGIVRQSHGHGRLIVID
jgi:hypothetical protein